MFALGDYNAICDLCGFKYKASELSMTWDNLWVCEGCFNTRHPQDFVKGSKDDQTVPIARPDVDSGIGSTTVKTTASKFAFTLAVDSTTGISDGDSIGIELDNDVYHWTFVDGSPSGYNLTIGSPLPFQTTSGNTVYLPSINNETFITATSVTASGL